MKKVTKDALEQLRWAREEERHEIAWIGHRMGWVLLAQSFLITAAIMAQSKDYPWWCGSVVAFILGCLGAWLAIRGNLAIRAAQVVIASWLRREQLVCLKHGGLTPYRLHRPVHKGEPSEKDPLHNVSVKFHAKMVWPIIVTWVLLFLVALFISLNRFHVGDPPAQISPLACTPAYTFFSLQLCEGGLFVAASIGALISAFLVFYLCFKNDFGDVHAADQQLVVDDKVEFALLEQTPKATDEKAKTTGKAKKS